MGHCVGGYCDSVQSRGTKIYSLRDKNGNPHVTIETRPGKGWTERSGVFYENPELEAPWRTFHEQAYEAQGRRHNPDLLKEFPDWLQQNAPDVYTRHASVFESGARRHHPDQRQAERRAGGEVPAVRSGLRQVAGVG